MEHPVLRADGKRNELLFPSLCHHSRWTLKLARLPCLLEKELEPNEYRFLQPLPGIEQHHDTTVQLAHVLGHLLRV